MVKASVTTADKPGVDSAAAHMTLNFGATPLPPKAEALHGTVNIRKGLLVSLLVVAICAGNVLTTPLLSMFQTFSHLLDSDSSIISRIAQKLNTVQLDSREDDLNKALLEDDTDYDYVDSEYGDDNAEEPELELEPEAKLKGLADILYGGLYTGVAQGFIYNDGRVWSHFTVSEMKDHLRCSEYYQRAEQTIHDQDAWKEMRRTYVRVVGADASTVGPPESSYNGFSRPYQVGHNNYGRGIYAKADIPKGSLVWQNIRSAAFSEGMQFREFVMTLPPELGCDVLQWSYVMDEKIYCDLDEGSFCNDGYSVGSNIDIDKEASAKFIAKAGMQLFASRDIKEGEELLCNYTLFSDGDYDMDEALLEDDTDYDYVDSEYGDDNAEEPELELELVELELELEPEPELEPEAKLKGLADILYGGLYTGVAQGFIYNDGRVWSHFTVSEMKDHLRCSEYYQRAEQTIHDQDAWKEMRRTYVRVVGADASTVGPPESSYNGFSRPYQVGHNNYGRGIYAKADIPKGSLVWQNIRSAAFSEGMQFREFVMTLPPELGCDVLQWSYVMDEKIYCDLDEGSFCNNGYSVGSNIDIDEEVSAKFIAKAGMQLFASRDIKEGEELLCNYASFSDGDWGLFGL